MLRTVFSHHDVFRLRFSGKHHFNKRKNAHKKQCYLLATSKSLSDFPLETVEIPAHSITDTETFITELAQKTQANFDLQTSPLIKAYLLTDTPKNKTQLVLIIHHLLVDGVSWRILLDEISSLHENTSLQLATSDSFQAWGNALKKYASTATLQSQYTHWEKICATHFTIPVDHQLGENREETADTVSITLTPNETSSLLQIKFKTHHLLISCLVKIISEWANTDALLLDLESQGRADTLGVDISHTVGWFTSLFPVCLNYKKSASFEENINAIHTQLIAISNYGIDYGVLRYLKNNKDLGYTPQVSFNYWGQLDTVFSKDSSFTIDTLKLISSPKNKRTHLLNIEAVIHDGALKIEWVYSKNFHKKPTVQKLAEQYLVQLRDLLFLSAQSPNLEGESVFNKQASVSRTKLTSLQGRTCDVLRLNTLSPSKSTSKSTLTSMQKGLLFQSISTPNHGIYTVQLYWTLAADICMDTFKQALQALIDRHPILRTRFDWKQQEPLQMIEENVVLNTKTYDWRTLSQSQQNTSFEEFLQADRNAGFSLDVAPLVRSTFIKTTEKTPIFILSLHHVLLDGWSIALLLRELNDVYHALTQHKPLELSTPHSYFSYVDWLQHVDLKKAETFWRAYLKDMTSPHLIRHTPLHKALKKQTVSPTMDYHTQFLVLSPALSHTLRHFLKHHKFTLSTFFHGLWAILLHRYTQQEDVIFGTTVSVRPPELPHIDQMVGLMINTLPMRVNFSHDRSVIDYLSHLQNDFLTVLEHQHTPLTHIQAWSGLETFGTHELFETLMVVENYPVEELPELHVKFQDMTIVDPTHYPLTLTVIPNEQITLKFAFDANRIDVDRLQDTMGHVQVLLHEFLQKPQQAIHRLEFLSAQEYKKIMVDWNPSLDTHNVSHSITQIFETQVKKYSDNIALVFKDQTLTYEALNRKANQLAHFLQKKGVQKEMLVALCVERNLDMLIGILGILKAGAAYVPLDPHYPAARIEYMLNDCASPFLVTHGNVLETLSLNVENINVIHLETDSVLIAQMPSHNLSAIKPHQLAYVIYTSGSTGEPKGVLIEHHSVTQLLKAGASLYQFTHTDCWTLFHSFNFDFSVWEMWGALFFGGKLMIVSQEMQHALDTFYNFLLQENVSILNVTPSVFDQLVALDQKSTHKLSCRLIIFGGEALSLKPLMPWVKKYGHNQPKLINMYGITETSISISHCPLKPTFKNNEAPSCIGKPFQGRLVYVLDAQLKPLPVNCVGELFVGGECVGRGYLNRSALTQEKFIANPFVNGPESHLYRTGDLVKWSPNGNLEYHGRLDDQVKICGYRVELAEIATRLEKHPSIHQAVVLLHATAQENKQLVAYVMVQKTTSVTAQELRIFLNQYLPDYMVPLSFVFLSEMPITSNGKIDKEALLRFSQIERVKKRHVSPKSAEEKQIATLWSQVLNIKKISVHDHFFEVGGNSFSVLKIISLMQTAFNVGITAQHFLMYPTVAELATLVQLLQNEKNAFSAATQKISQDKFFNCLVPLQPNGSKAPLFLVHPVGGTVFWYISLAKHLDLERPLYGIQDLGVEMDTVLFNTVEEMAHFYIQAIRSIQPHGPYLIGGASGGATISVEIARQLEAKGESVAFIALLDGWAPFPEMLKNQAFFEANMRRQYNTMHRQFLAKGIPKAETLLNLQWQRSQMLANYHVPVLNNKLTLFKAIDTISVFQSIDSPFNHWEKHATQPIELHHVPGDHESMFQEPYVITLAKQLNTCLAHSCKQTRPCVMV